MNLPNKTQNRNLPETAVIIRTRNEERWIGETLRRLQVQTYQNFEIIVVDSGSTDNTLQIVSTFPEVHVVAIKPTNFTYPYAINVGIKNSRASTYLVILSAHSLPIGKQWLACAVNAISADTQAMGVYGPLKAMPDGTLMDKLIHNGAFYLDWLLRRKSIRTLTSYEPGALGFTNALIRRDLWEQHTIDEAYAGGGEDTAWMQYWLSRGMHALKCRDFVVHHSHYLGPVGWYKQFQHWKKNATPQPFTYLDYRPDPAHSTKDTTTQPYSEN